MRGKQCDALILINVAEFGIMRYRPELGIRVFSGLSDIDGR